MKKLAFTMSLLFLLIGISSASYDCVTNKPNSIIPNCKYLENFSDNNAVATLNESDTSSNSDDSSSTDSSGNETSDTDSNQENTNQQSCQTVTYNVCTFWILWWCISWGTASQQVCT